MIKLVKLNKNNPSVYCPNLNMQIWSLHPRVFLELDEKGFAICPYCRTVYQLDILHKSSKSILK